MRSQATTGLDPLPVSRSGVIVAEGYGLKLYVRRGMLCIEDGEGPNGRRLELVRSTSRGMRIVLLGRAGSISVESLCWMRDAGVGFATIDAASGHIVAANELEVPSRARLRRLQALAAERSVGLEIAKRLIELKLVGQLDVLRDHFPDAKRETEIVASAIEDAHAAVSFDDLRRAEAEGASAYWQAWTSLSLSFVAKDLARVPEHWMTFPSRRSWIAGTGPRSSGCPLNALLNLGYGLASIEARLGCLAIGLDPSIGVLHADQDARDSLALDALEVVRPRIDRWVIDAARGRVWRKADFFETRRGIFRVGPEIARAMADSLLPMSRTAVAPVIEGVTQTLAASSEGRPVNVATRLTETRRRRGRGRMPVPALNLATCRVCGAQLEDRERAICDDCLPAFEAERTGKLVSAAKETLADMRASAQDPAQSEEARRKRIDKAREMSLAARAWEREHGPVADPSVYEREILPKIRAMSVRRLVALTGLSEYYLWKIRKGEGRLHPRFWASIRGVRERSGQSSGGQTL